MKEEQQQNGETFIDTDSQHSLVCNETLFYAGVRAAAEDTEKEE